MLPTIEACWNWAYQREDMNAPFDFFVYVDAHEKTRQLLTPLEEYFLDLKAYVNTFYNAYTHYCITTDYRVEYEKVWAPRPMTPLDRLPMTDLTPSETKPSNSIPMTELTPAGKIEKPSVDEVVDIPILNDFLTAVNKISTSQFNTIKDLNDALLDTDNKFKLVNTVTAYYSDTTRTAYLAAIKNYNTVLDKFKDAPAITAKPITALPDPASQVHSIPMTDLTPSETKPSNSIPMTELTNSTHSIPMTEMTDAQRWVINTMYKKYNIAANAVIYNSVSDGSSSTSAQMFKSLNEGDFLMQDLLRTPYGTYVYQILEQMRPMAVLL